MKTIIIKDIDNKEIELNFSKLTQLTGSNYYLKNYIVTYIYKYFSNERYLKDDINIYNVSEPEVFLGNELLKRSSFESLNIDLNLDVHLKNTKNSLLYNYILNLFENIDISYHIEKIDNEKLLIETILKNNLNSLLYKYIDIESEFIQKDFILQNFFDVCVKKDLLSLKNLSNYEKILLILNLVEEYLILDNKKFLICIHGLENFVPYKNLDEFNRLILNLIEKYNIFFLISFDKSGYALGGIEDLENINIISDINTSLPNIYALTETINRHYPTNYNWKEEELYEILKNIIHNLFNSDYIYKLNKEDVIIKILNKFYDINCKVYQYDIIELEKRYLLDNPNVI